MSRPGAAALVRVQDARAHSQEEASSLSKGRGGAWSNFSEPAKAFAELYRPLAREAALRRQCEEAGQRAWKMAAVIQTVAPHANRLAELTDRRNPNPDVVIEVARNLAQAWRASGRELESVPEISPSRRPKRLARQ